MRTSGAMPHASACMIWARPISSPSAVTPLLSAMFWLLKGVTRRPSCESTRHSPAASRLFPAFDMVPWIMMGFALPTGIDLLRRASAIRARHSAAARSAAPFVGLAFVRCTFRPKCAAERHRKPGILLARAHRDAAPETGQYRKRVARADQNPLFIQALGDVFRRRAD